MNGLIPTQNNDALAGVRNLFRHLMDAHVVEALYVPLETENSVITPALVTDPVYLERANPFAPAMPINGARAVAEITGKHAPAQIGVVLRSCELRALMDLIKLQQSSLEQLVLIGVDCPGTYEWAEYNRLQRDGGLSLDDYLAAGSRGENLASPALRVACQMCNQPVPEPADIRLHIFGADLSQGIPITVEDGIASLLELEPVEVSGADGRQAVVDRVIAQRDQVRQRSLPPCASDWMQRMASPRYSPPASAATTARPPARSAIARPACSALLPLTMSRNTTSQLPGAKAPCGC